MAQLKNADNGRPKGRAQEVHKAFNHDGSKKRKGKGDKRSDSEHPVGHVSGRLLRNLRLAIARGRGTRDRPPSFNH